MNKIIALNLKMNLTYEEALMYVNKVKNNLGQTNEIIICPSFIYLPLFKEIGYELGAQNVFDQENGAYTGEISASQLKSLGVSHVIVGHSERRLYFKESDDFIASKLKVCLKHQLKPILCIGESLEERKNNHTEIVLKHQLDVDLMNMSKEEVNNIIIAYEPIWAIGTGETPMIEDISSAIDYIKEIVNVKYQVIPKVLYGGSVNLGNIKEITNIKVVDGVLVGGASVNPDNAVSLSKV